MVLASNFRRSSGDGIIYYSLCLCRTKIKNTVVPRVLFQNETFISANIVGFLINFALFGGIFMFGLFLQKAYGASPFVAGLQLLPMMSVFVIGNVLFAKMVSKFSSKALLFIALFIASMGSLLLMLLVNNVSYIELQSFIVLLILESV